MTTPNPRDALAGLINQGAYLHTSESDCRQCAASYAVAAAILAAGWTPPPRVFLEGDDIPCHLAVIDNHGEVRDEYQDYDEGDGEVYTANFDVVEMNIDYDAAVARERARRAEDAERRADRHAEIVEAERSEEVHGG